MKYIVFIILIISIVLLYLYYENKLSITRKQLMITSNQYNQLKKQYRSPTYNSQNIVVKFSTPVYKTAITNTNVSIHLAPIVNSPKLKTLTEKVEVKILDTATINNSTWFYISLPTDSDINSRGWINQNDFSLIYSSNIDSISDK